MKLKNKKTGEISDLVSVLVDNYDDISLAKINDKWEDYDYPTYYYLYGHTVMSDEDIGDVKAENLKSVGNYFETEEEAEKAVEKLKAWKQLKDNCNFRFNGVERDEQGRLIGVKVEFDKAQVTFDTAKRCYEILDLLFGGEE